MGASQSVPSAPQIGGDRQGREIHADFLQHLFCRSVDRSRFLWPVSSGTASCGKPVSSGIAVTFKLKIKCSKTVQGALTAATSDYCLFDC
jgi:hypothetical protein